MTALDILVVDANRTVRRIVERTLRAEGHRVLAFGSGAEALRAAEQVRPALVLVDVRGGEGEGADDLEGLGLRRAFARRDTLRHVPFVTMQADRDEPVANRGAGDTLRKPFSPEALVAALTATLARAHQATSGARATGAHAALEHGDTPGRAELSLGPEDALAGRLDHLSLADVLQLLSAQQQTGTLEVRGDELAVAICLGRGQIDLALGAGTATAGLRLGRLLVEEGAVSRGTLGDALATQARARGAETGDPDDPATRLGAILVGRRALTHEALLRSLERQTTELVALALRAARGTFRFRRLRVPREAAEARLARPLSPLLLDGLRRLDEWRLLEARVSSLDVVLARADAGSRSIGEGVLCEAERRVLERLDGCTSLRDLGEPEIVPIATRLLALRVARVAGDD